MRKKIFVGCNPESRGAVLPFDFECSTCVNLVEGGNCPVIRFDVAVASNANPPASKGQNHADSQQYNRSFLHVNDAFSKLDAAMFLFGFKEIPQGAISRSPGDGRETGVDLIHFTICSFTASTRTSST
jgi:hypothetical protein